jgi:hypothetical protein
MNPTWIIDSADERGVPTVAHCEECGFQWSRPAGDEQADSLPQTALYHRRIRHDR